MTRQQALAESYRQHYVLSRGDRAQRAEAVRFWWAGEEVHEGVAEGTLPVEMLHALLNATPADEEFGAYVAAGAIEDALTLQPQVYSESIALRCAVDPLGPGRLRVSG